MEAGANNKKSNNIDKKIIRDHRDIVEQFVWERLSETGEFVDNNRDSYYTAKLYATSKK